MTTNPKTIEYFEVFYHPDKFIRQFKYAFDTLARVVLLIKAEFPGFLEVIQEKATYPMITVTHKKNQAEQFPKLYFSELKV